MRAVQIQEFGGPEVLELVELPEPEAGPDEVVVEVARAGMNFADTHQRENDYLAKAELPLVPGGEIAGRTGDGRRVAAMLANGGYAERAAVPRAALVPIPDEVSDDQAAGVLLQGLTAWALLNVSAGLRRGESIVVGAAAGGTGTLAVQLAKRAGAGRVIALASTAEKRSLAERLGADATVDSRAGDLGEAILAANDGEQVDVVLEMSGGAAFDACLSALAPFGRLVSFGIASREPNQVMSQKLMRTSRAVVGFWLVHLLRRPDLLGQGITELLEAVASGKLEVVIGRTYALSEVADAHRALQGRATHGKLLLDPSR
ncbi:MAG: NADPH:quinone oxidoreductase family protein [Acidobacteria bacterium]|nr:MAG: NADPH:quinone oxidoreductase family protein [Acidobacteriota bacterium]GIK78811.1 MAG: NADPH:quinone reductase [Actinomycetes bacterium]